MDDHPILDLTSLGEPPGMPALTPARGLSYAEAAAVCLEDNHHEQNVRLKVRGKKECGYRLRWPVASEQTKATYRDMQDATRDGACAVALLVARELTGLTAISQSWKSTGFDYWLGASPNDFQNSARLEISGILKGDERKIRSRVSRKAEQTKQSDGMKLPAYICVVEFSSPLVSFTQR